MTVWLSTAPTEPLTHWYQVRCLLQSPLFTKAGDTLSGTALLIANKRYTGSTPAPPPGSHYTSPSESMWNTGGSYNMNQSMAVTVNTGIVNHTPSRVGSIMSTGIVQGATTGQSGQSSSITHYPVNSQFTMGGPAISMASPMAVPSNTMHYGNALSPAPNSAPPCLSFVSEPCRSDVIKAYHHLPPPLDSSFKD
ncbi:hypothetical protein JZ751_021516 [Albula glossodonta]|uniref:Uncharacterized protein n=1 Tax=Albula glossodonta TaxID=121402 RepID=A0A8T2NIB1_9TELE|nr:hypothetical protein JZ751_021516 [Albula glossodonta]